LQFAQVAAQVQQQVLLLQLMQFPDLVPHTLSPPSKAYKQRTLLHS
jgi:hypothetical protein